MAGVISKLTAVFARKPLALYTLEHLQYTHTPLGAISALHGQRVTTDHIHVISAIKARAGAGANLRWHLAPHSLKGSPHFHCPWVSKLKGEAALWSLWVTACSPEQSLEERCGWRCKKNNPRTVGVKGETIDLASTEVEFLNLNFVYRSGLQLLSRKVVFPFLSVYPPPLMFLTVKVNN